MERYKITTKKENDPTHMSISCVVTDNYSTEEKSIPCLRWEGDYEDLSMKVRHVSPELVAMFELGQFLSNSMKELELLVHTTDPLVVKKMINEVDKYIKHIVNISDRRVVREKGGDSIVKDIK